MTVVPLLALAGNWQVAAPLIVLERVGKATRNPPRDVMLSHADKQIGGYGCAFGLHEALDQFGALVGPLAVAGILAVRHGGFRLAFAMLAVPAAIMLTILVIARSSIRAPRRRRRTRRTSGPKASLGPSGSTSPAERWWPLGSPTSH